MNKGKIRNNTVDDNYSMSLYTKNKGKEGDNREMSASMIVDRGGDVVRREVEIEKLEKNSSNRTILTEDLKSEYPLIF